MLTKKDRELAKINARWIFKKLDSGKVDYLGKNPCFKPVTHKSAINIAKAVTLSGIDCRPPSLKEWELLVTETPEGRLINPVLTIYKPTFVNRKPEAIFGAKSFDDTIVSKAELLLYVKRVKK